MSERLVGRTSGIGLTLRGREQTKKTAEYLEDLAIDKIITSPQQRARETADILAALLKLPIEQNAGFDELEFGEWVGLSFADVSKVPGWQMYNSMRSLTRPPGGESLRETQARVLRTLFDLHSSSMGSVFAIVTHADVIRSAVSYFSGAPLDLFLRFAIEPASVSIVEVGDAAVQIRCLNRTG